MGRALQERRWPIPKYILDAMTRGAEAGRNRARQRDRENEARMYRFLGWFPKRLVPLAARIVYGKWLHRNTCRLCNGRKETRMGWSEALICPPEPCTFCHLTGKTYDPA